MKIISLDTYEARRALGAATTQDLAFFQGQTVSATEINTLATQAGDNILPDNATGTLKALYAYFTTLNGGATEATNTAAAKTVLDLVHAANIEFYVNDIQVAFGPLWRYCHPGVWFQGAVDAAAGIPGEVQTMQNAGAILGFLEHPIGVRHRIRARVATKYAIATAAANTQFLTIGFDVMRERMVG